MFDGQSDESPSVLGNPSTDCMIVYGNRHTVEKKGSNEVPARARFTGAARDGSLKAKGRVDHGAA